MTYHQENLLEKAHEYWSVGRELPLHLASQIAQEGFDLVQLEIKYMKEPQHG